MPAPPSRRRLRSRRLRTNPGSAHRLRLVEPDPALDHPVERPQPRDHPERIGDDDADDRDETDPAEDEPHETPPERADLPGEVRFHPRPLRLVALHVREDDPDEPGDADEEPDRVARVDRVADIDQTRRRADL